MPTFAGFLIALDGSQRSVRGMHASLQQTGCFVYAPPASPPPASVPTQQIVIIAASICTVSYGGR